MAFDKNNSKNRKRRKVCQFCVDKATSITGTCAMHQRQLTEAIKRARQIALMPYVTD